MAHWAEIDSDSKVIRVVVTSNEEADEGYQWLIDNLGGVWVKTSYNSRGGIHYTSEVDSEGKLIPSGKPHFRYNYASPGFTYDEAKDAFIPPQPNGEGWILDDKTYLWYLPEQTEQTQENQSS